jgi:hypothetical protein
MFKGSKVLKVSTLLLITGAVLLGTLTGGTQTNLTAVVIEANGKAAYRRSGDSQLQPIQAQVSRLSAGDMIVTGPNSKVVLQIEGKVGQADEEHPAASTVEIGPKAKVLMTELFTDLTSGNESVTLGVAEGQIISNVRRIDPNSERFRVETPTAVAAVRGTKFLTDVSWRNDIPNVSFQVERGSIDLFNRGSGARMASLNRGEIADIDPSGSVSVGAASDGSANSTSGEGGGKSITSTLGGGKTSATSPGGGESSDTTNAPQVGDDEGDDVGGRN